MEAVLIVSVDDAPEIIEAGLNEAVVLAGNPLTLKLIVCGFAPVAAMWIV